MCVCVCVCVCVLYFIYLIDIGKTIIACYGSIRFKQKFIKDTKTVVRYNFIVVCL